MRRLKLNRFVGVEPTDIPCAIPDDFSLAEYRGKAWRMIRGDRLHQVVIDVAADVAETVSDTNWHPTQRIEDHADGSVTSGARLKG